MRRSCAHESRFEQQQHLVAHHRAPHPDVCQCGEMGHDGLRRGDDDGAGGGRGWGGDVDGGGGDVGAAAAAAAGVLPDIYARND